MVSRIKKAMHSIDTVQFINDVHERPSIWDRTHLMDKAYRKDVWGELCEIYGCPKKVLQKKWKYLRDSFRKIYKRIPRDKDGVLQRNPEDFPTRCPFYKQLLFLVDHTHSQPRWQGCDSNDSLSLDLHVANFCENVAEEPQDYSELPQAAAESLPAETLGIAMLTPKIEPRTDEGETRPRRRHGKRARRDSSPIEDVSIEPQQLMDSLAETLDDPQHFPPAVTSSDFPAPASGLNFDDDYYFLMSLRPYLQQCSPAQKLKIKVQIQTLIFKELYKDEELN